MPKEIKHRSLPAYALAVMHRKAGAFPDRKKQSNKMACRKNSNK